LRCTETLDRCAKESFLFCACGWPAHMFGFAIVLRKETNDAPDPIGSAAASHTTYLHWALFAFFIQGIEFTKTAPHGNGNSIKVSQSSSSVTSTIGVHSYLPSIVFLGARAGPYEANAASLPGVLLSLVWKRGYFHWSQKSADLPC